MILSIFNSASRAMAFPSSRLSQRLKELRREFLPTDEERDAAYLVVSQIRRGDAKGAITESCVQAASISNCSASDGCGLWAYFACPLRIM